MVKLRALHYGIPYPHTSHFGNCGRLSIYSLHIVHSIHATLQNKCNMLVCFFKNISFCTHLFLGVPSLGLLVCMCRVCLFMLSAECASMLMLHYKFKVPLPHMHKHT